MTYTDPRDPINAHVLLKRSGVHLASSVSGIESEPGGVSIRRLTKEVDMSINKNTWSAMIWVLPAVAQIVVAMVAGAEEPKEILFHDSYNKAIQEARLTQRPIFLEFRCAP